MQRIEKMGVGPWCLIAKGVLFISLLFCQCGHQKAGERRVLVTTDTQIEDKEATDTAEAKEPPATRSAEELLDRIQADELQSAEIIREYLNKQGDRELAAWAAVYALHLKIKHDETQSKRAIEKVAKLDDPLLVALCWRWLASKRSFKLPSHPKIKGLDPVSQAMAALAVASRKPLRKELNWVLGLPDIDLPKKDPDRYKETKDRVEKLLYLAAQYDDGPLALAVTFVETRRQEWIETDKEGNPGWVAKRLRAELVKIGVREEPKVLKRIEASKPYRGDGFSVIGERLDFSLLSHTREMLHSIVVTGEAKLQIQALAALCVVAREPTIEDFGAAASALESKSPAVRLKGAHTFLYLSLRARKNP